MAVVAFSYFLPEVAMEVIGCPNPVITHALRSAAIEFCRRSMAWVAELDGFPTEADVNAYDLALPTETELVMPKRVFVSGVEIFPMDTGLDTDIGTTVAELGSATTTHYAVNGDNQLVLVPAPAAADLDVVAHVAVCPTRDGDSMDAVLASLYYEQIASGAIARLAAQEDKPWFNQTKADRRAARFEAGILSALNRMAKGRTVKSSYIRPVKL